MLFHRNNNRIKNQVIRSPPHMLQKIALYKRKSFLWIGREPQGWTVLRRMKFRSLMPSFTPHLIPHGKANHKLLATVEKQMHLVLQTITAMQKHLLSTLMPLQQAFKEIFLIYRLNYSSRAQSTRSKAPPLPNYSVNKRASPKNRNFFYPTR